MVTLALIVLSALAGFWAGIMFVQALVLNLLDRVISKLHSHPARPVVAAIRESIEHGPFPRNSQSKAHETTQEKPAPDLKV